MALPSSRLGPGLAANTSGSEVSAPYSDASTSYAVGNLVNQNAVAEGPNIPPPQSGTWRVPRPSSFRVDAQIPTSVGEIILFSWLDAQKPITEVAGYRIFAKFSYNQNQEPTQIGTSSHSPCASRITADTVGVVVFFLQPYLLNGLTLPLDACPTTTVNIVAAVPPAGTVPGGTTTVFDTNDTWTAPAGVTRVYIQCWGAGGNGGNATGVGGGGGGGGAYAADTMDVIPGNNYTVSVATGGSGSGTKTYFNSLASVAADSGDNGTDGSGGIPGAGGAGGNVANCIGITRSSGNAGQAGFGGGSNGGDAGQPGGGSAGGAGQNGFPPGGGGGGADIIGHPAPGTGADGRVSLTY